MKFNSEFNKESLKAEYYEKKIFIVPATAIFIAILLFLFFILPQVLDFPSRVNDIDRENQKLDKIKTSLSIASSADAEKLDFDIQVLSRTLPQGKNFEKILNSISTSASLSNTLILSYKFQDLASIFGTNIKDIPALNFKIEIIGGPRDASLFIDELYKLNPISEVIKITTDEGSTTIEVVFYYKPFETLNQEQKIELNNITSEQSATLDIVSSWPDIVAPTFFNLPTESSASATDKGFPF